MKKFFAILGALFVFCSCSDCSCSESSDEAKHSNAQLIVNGHKFVDLGLPSGLLWAETNVGASSASEDGDYFAWGETEPKTEYTWDNYKWSDDIKYNSLDGKTTLESADDAATVKWGAPCRMPDSSEFSELYNKCDWSWKSSYNGASGYLVTGPNGNSIFIPASGSRGSDDLYNHGSGGLYWSRSLFSGGISDARCLYFGRGSVNPTGSGYRCHGFSVRPVAEK